MLGYVLGGREKPDLLAVYEGRRQERKNADPSNDRLLGDCVSGPHLFKCGPDFTSVGNPVFVRIALVVLGKTPYSPAISQGSLL